MSCSSFWEETLWTKSSTALYVKSFPTRWNLWLGIMWSPSISLICLATLVISVRKVLIQKVNSTFTDKENTSKPRISSFTMIKYRSNWNLVKLDWYPNKLQLNYFLFCNARIQRMKICIFVKIIHLFCKLFYINKQ
jgi:hypothetical protein